MLQSTSKYDMSSNSIKTEPSYCIHGAFKKGKDFSAKLIAGLASE